MVGLHCTAAAAAAASIVGVQPGGTTMYRSMTGYVWGMECL